MDIPKEIKKIRENSGVSLSELSKMTKIAKSTLQRYETGTTKKIPMDAISSIEKALNLPTGHLMGWEEKPTRYDNDPIDLEKYGLKAVKTKKFRMLGEIACGKPMYADEDYETFVEASADINADFCLTAKGDSMINARIFDGDIVFIREQPIVDNGEIAAVIICDENTATLKRVYIKPEKLILRAENPMYNDIVFEREEMNNVRILGKAVAFMSNVL